VNIFPRYLLKRIIALPNETMEIKEGKIYIDGKLYDEPYLEYQSSWNLRPVELDSDHYYIIGDNRSMSASEHVHLKVHRKNIIGKIFP
jgi:signal peptidase I